MKTFLRAGATALLLLSPLASLASLVEDRQMEKAARASYVYRVVLEDRVKASAEFGVLTLTGSVEDDADRLLAEDTARHLRWVESVNNKVIIQSSFAEKSDPWIARKIRGRLLARSGVNADTTRVTVLDGMVTLDGTAGDERQKARTALIAKEIPGVYHVRNQLVVVPRTGGGEANAEPIDDASIAAHVIATLRAHAATRTVAIKVRSTEGTVRLTGQADSEVQKSLITELTREIHGTWVITNSMTSPR